MNEEHILRHLLDRRMGFDPAAILAGSEPAPLAPDTPVSGRMSADGAVWFPPRRSVATRRPSARSKGSCRGSMIDPSDNREIVFESNLEAGLATMLVARRDIERVVDQPPAVTYRDADGVLRSHTFDFLATTVTDVRIAYAVKPQDQVESSGIEETLELIRQQVGGRFADRYLLRTDHDITRNKVENADLILRSRCCRNHEDVARMRDLVSTLRGSVRLADLVTQSGLGARGFTALVNLLDEGEIETVGGTLIEHRAQVRRSLTK